MLTKDFLADGWTKALSVDRKQLNMFFERMMDGFAYHKIVVDSAGKPVDYIFLEVNNAFERMTGLKRESIIGKKVTEVLKGIENDSADWIGRYGGVALTCEPIQFENYAEPLDKWYSVSAYCPEKGYFVALFEDITERKKADYEIKKAKDDWERTFDAVPDFIAMLDTNHRIIRANKAMAQQLGVTPEKAVGLTCYECIHGANAPPDYCPHAQLLKDSQQHTAELNEPRLGGDFIVSATPLKDLNGKLIGSIHVARNISQRKKAEEGLRTLNENLEELVRERTKAAANERKRLYQVLETLPSYVVLLDKNYHVVFANKVFRELFGESKGRPCYEFLFNSNTPCENCETYKVLKTSKSHHWEWTGPNGRDYDINDFPFVDEDGSTLILEMGLDATDRKHAEAELKKYQGHLEKLVAERTEALRESEQRWATTLSSIGDAVIATDIEGKITFMNPVAEELTGWTLGEAKQKSIKQVFNIINEQTRKEVESPVAKVLQEGLIVGLANHTVLIRKDGTEVPIDDSGAPIVTEDGGVIRGVVLVFRDITERKKNEDALQRQASLIDLSPDAIIVRKLDGTIIFWSKGAEKLYGWTQQEAIGKRTHTLFQTKFPEPYNTITAKLTTEKRWSGELVHKTKDGYEVTVQSRWLTEETEHGEIRSILESNVDVTERKKAEEHLQKLNRALKAISDSNQALMRATDEQSFLQEACKIIAEDCGYKMVWVGLAEDDAAKTVRPVAYAGLDEGYINTLNITWADTERGRGPTGRAIRTGEPQFCEDMHKDPEFAPWRREALKRGFASSIALPLKSGSKTFGALTMYSKELNVCSADEIALMRELAGDFAHGIMLLRLRAEKERGEKEIVRLASFPTLNPTPVIEVGADGRITYANPATKVLFPTLETEGINHIFFNDWRTVKNTLNDKGVVTFGREVKVNNHWYHQQFYLVPYTQQIRIYATDIDELKQTELARAKAQTKLEENAVQLEEYASQMEELAEQRAQQLQNAERLAAIGATAGMVGHDIRNPLQAITGDMYLISEEIKDLPEGDCKDAVLESIESVNRNLVYINKIVSDLQDYTRPLKPNLQDANLSELVEGTLATITIPKGIEVTTEIKENAKPIKTDAAFMRRILTNLLTNAVQAMQEEGKLTLNASKLHDTIILTIEDTGIGIPDEVKAKMFTPLFTTKSKGQGLGLAVVKRLVEALGGSITFESLAGKGTKFIVEFSQKQ